MASVLKRRVLAVGTTTMTSQEQSIETVQVMIYSAVSLLCRMRDIFHVSAYDNREFSDEDELYTFGSLLSGNHNSNHSPRSPSSTSPSPSEPNFLTVPLLKKNRSERVDLFFSMLDTVFEALRRKTLRSLRIGFVASPQAAEDFIEMYDFGINYRDAQHGGREVDGLQCRYMEEDTYAQGIDAQGCVFNLLARLYDVCLDMPSLPAERYLIATIRYTEDDWEPEGFTRTSKQGGLISDLTGWQPQTKDLGISEGVFHNVSLGVRFLRHAHSSVRRLSQDLVASNPHGKHGNGSPLTETEHRPLGTVQPERHVEARSKVECGPVRSSTSSVFEDPKSTANTPNDSHDTTTSQVSPPPQTTGVVGRVEGKVELPGPSQSRESQLLEDMRVKDLLRNMLEPSLAIESASVTQPRADGDQIVHEHDSRSDEVVEQSEASAQPMTSAYKRHMGSGSQVVGGSKSITPAKKARFNEANARNVTPVTRGEPQRAITKTPMVRESTFNFLINGRSLPSGERSVTRSVPLDRE